MATTALSTTLEFGLVSVGIRLKKVQEKKGTSFALASPDGNPVKQTYVDEITGEIVGTRADCQRGIFNGDFHPVAPEAIEAIDEETKLDSFAIEGFLPLGEVPFERAQGCYFVAPGGKGATPAQVKPLVLLREGLKLRNAAGYGRFTLRAKTYSFVVYAEEVEPGEWGLLVNTLVYADEFKQVAEAAEVLEGVDADENLAQMAGTLIDTLGGSRDALDAYTDDRTDKREELVVKALAGETITVTPKAEKPAADVADLSKLLAASIGEASKKPAAAKSKSKAAA